MTRQRPICAALVLFMLLPALGGCASGLFGTEPPPPPAKKRTPPPESALTVATPKPPPAKPKQPLSPLASPPVPVEESRLAVPPSPPDKRGVIGHNEDETEKLLGKPVRVLEQASAKIWRYQGDDCAVDVTFFFDVSRGRFFALDVTPVTGDVNQCLAKLEGHVAS